MFESYPDIEYDEKTRRINRRMKVLGVVVLVLTFGGLVALGSLAEETDSGATQAQIRNDTNGTVTCVGVYRLDDLSGTRQVRETGRLAANGDAWVVYGSSCAVFDRNGDYVSCLRVRKIGAEGMQFLASAGDRRVKADACVYPR